MFFSLLAPVLLWQTGAASSPAAWYQSSLDNQTVQLREDDSLNLSIRSATGDVMATLSRKKITDKFKGTTLRLAPQCPNGKGKIEVIDYTPARIRMRVEKPQQSLNGSMGCMMIGFVQWENFDLVPAAAPAPGSATPVSTGKERLFPPTDVSSPSRDTGRWVANLARPLETRPLESCIVSVEARRDCIEIILAASAQNRPDIIEHWVYPKWRDSGWTNPKRLEIPPLSSPACGRFLGVWPRTKERDQGFLEYEKCWGGYHIDFSERGHLSDIFGGAGPIAFDLESLRSRRPSQFARAQSEIASAQTLLELVASGASVEEVRQAMVRYGDTIHDPASYRQTVLAGSQQLFGAEPAGTFERCYLLDATFEGDKLVNDEFVSQRLSLIFRCIFSGGERRFPLMVDFEKNQRRVGDLAGNYSVSPRSRHPY